MVKVCIAGVTGWTGAAVAKGVLESERFQLVGAVARKTAGQDVGEVLGLKKCGVLIKDNLEKALADPADVLIEYTHANSVKEHVLSALGKKIRIVIGSSGLSGEDF